MPSANVCHYMDRRISVEEAKSIMRETPRLERNGLRFTCIHCGGRVKPHAGGGNRAHFEHKQGENEDCPIRHISRIRPSHLALQVERDFDDLVTIEGTKRDLELMTSDRDRKAAEACKKRDNYTCQACGYYLKIGTRYVIDCHHSYPLALGVRETVVDDLVSLCPTCHRIAHTRDVPLELEAIRSLVAERKYEPISGG